VFIEIVDSLRCPNEHADTWLVASCDTMDERRIVEGRLGCPVCRAEYPIRAGAVYFDESPVTTDVPVAPAEEGERLAAFLDLTDARGFAVLEGAFAAYAPGVAAIAPTQLVLLNPRAMVDPQPGISVVFSARGAPFATGSARAVAGNSDWAERLGAVVSPGGRVVAPAGTPTPHGVALLAGDERLWVGEKDAAAVSKPIPLARRTDAPSG
jgi:uncharacterized protein YbaR (Trm112 family)